MYVTICISFLQLTCYGNKYSTVVFYRRCQCELSSSVLIWSYLKLNDLKTVGVTIYQQYLLVTMSSNCAPFDKYHTKQLDSIFELIKNCEITGRQCMGCTIPFRYMCNWLINVVGNNDVNIYIEVHSIGTNVSSCLVRLMVITVSNIFSYTQII